MGGEISRAGSGGDVGDRRLRKVRFAGPDAGLREIHGRGLSTYTMKFGVCIFDPWPWAVHVYHEV